MRKRNRNIIAAIGALVVMAVCVAIGFNLHSTFSQEYSAGYRANGFFALNLGSAFWDYANREHAIADPTEHKEILDEIGALRIGVYRPWEGYRVPVFDGLTELRLKAEVIEPPIDVDSVQTNFDVIIFPQGGYHLDQLPAGEGDRLRQIVQSGVNFIGLCAGTFFAVDDLKIAPVDLYRRPMVAIMWVKTIATDYWGGLGDSLFQVHYANGGFFPRDQISDFEPLVEAKNLGFLAIKGKYGSGDVVLFTFHPEGGGLTLNQQSVYFNGRDLGSGPLLLRVLANMQKDKTSAY